MPDADAQFDPYEQWLGIAPEDQPPHHYRLLGLEAFTEDCDRIAAAADARMAELRKFQRGKHAEDSQRLLNELAAAKLCLLDEGTKTTYDAVLRGLLDAGQTPQSTMLGVPLPEGSPDLAQVARVGPVPHVPEPVEEPSSAAGTNALPSITPASVTSSRTGAAPSAVATAGEGEAVEEAEPFYARPRFPHVVIGSVATVAVLVWVAGRFFGGDSPATTSNPSGEGPDRPAAKKKANGGIRQQGDTITLPSNRGRVTGERYRWSFTATEPGIYRVMLTFAAAEAATERYYRILARDRRGRETKCDFSIRSTGGPDTFDTQQVGFLQLTTNGRYTLRIIPDPQNTDEAPIAVRELTLVNSHRLNSR